MTAGKDGVVLFWDLAAVIRTSVSNAPELAPRHSWSNHQATVCDVIFGSLDTKVASCSLDKTCKVSVAINHGPKLFIMIRIQATNENLYLFLQIRFTILHPVTN